MYLHIKFDGHEIIVTRPGTDMMTAYRKAPDRPNLILTRSWENPTVMSPEISEFRAHAFQAAGQEGARAGVDCVASALRNLLSAASLSRFTVRDTSCREELQAPDSKARQSCLAGQCIGHGALQADCRCQ